MGTPQGARRVDGWTIVLGLFGLSNAANGVWMLFRPGHWYETLPAGVPDFGPLNEHFVRDIGAAFSVMGLGLIVAALRATDRFVILAGVTSFYVVHALVHVVDTLRGFVGPEHWAIDFPGSYSPALILIVLTYLARPR